MPRTEQSPVSAHNELPTLWSQNEILPTPVGVCPMPRATLLEFGEFVVEQRHTAQLPFYTAVWMAKRSGTVSLDGEGRRLFGSCCESPSDSWH